MATLTDRTILITGAGSGLGRQLALTFAAEGARIAALDRNAAGLEELAARLGKGVAHAVADVTDLPGLRRAVADLEGRLGPTDVLIASAGIGRATPADAFRAEDIAAQVSVNLIGVANSIDAVLPGMLRRGRGHLVAISSLASYRGLPRMAGYCASKAGVNALCDALRVELRPRGIAVSTICPGWVRTALTDGLPVPASYMMNVEEAVARIAAAIRSHRPFLAFPAGSAWQVRLLRWLPGGVSDWLVRRYLDQMIRK